MPGTSGRLTGKERIDPAFIRGEFGWRRIRNFVDPLARAQRQRHSLGLERRLASKQVGDDAARFAIAGGDRTCAATLASTYALDAIATVAGVLLVASNLLGGIGHVHALLFLASTYIVWGAGLRINLRANWELLGSTGTSTNVLSKMAYDLARLRTSSAHMQRIAADAGYVCMEFAKELPYYAGAFGAAILTDSISSNEAIVFLGGANLGAAVYEYGLARLVRAFLRRADAPPTFLRRE